MFEEIFGPNIEFWRPVIYEELMSFVCSKVFKKKKKRHRVLQELSRKLMTMKLIFKEKTNSDDTTKYKARCCLSRIYAETRS
jgi:hypothetical protein